MKPIKIARQLTGVLICLVGMMAGSILYVNAQPAPPPEHGLNGNQSGGNAPIGEGLLITLTLTGIYAGRKRFKARRAGHGKHV